MGHFLKIKGTLLCLLQNLGGGAHVPPVPPVPMSMVRTLLSRPATPLVTYCVRPAQIEVRGKLKTISRSIIAWDGFQIFESV